MIVNHRIAICARAGVLACATLALSACADGLQLPFGPPDAASRDTTPAANNSQLIGRDVEAPEVFLAEEQGLWDGRPSLGGVWVAHPDATDPERVLIRNGATGETVVGALFRREREMPGPGLQISSDAAAALNVIAGQPTELEVVALRREEVPETLDIAVAPPEAAPEPAGETAMPGAIAATSLDPAADQPTAPAADVIETAALETAPVDPVAAAAAAIERAEASMDAADILAATAASATAPMELPATAAPAEAPTAQPIETAALAPAAAAPAAPAPQSSNLDRPFIQIGIFSVEDNANATAGNLRNAGMIPIVHDQESSGSRFWRVVVGPARTRNERAALLESVRGLGFEDAYFVTN